MKIITRKEALARGLKMYFTGKPCTHGHIAERRASDRICSECNRVRARTFYKTNSESVLQHQREFRRKHNEQIRLRKRRHYVKNRTKLLARKACWREKNLDKVREYQRRYQLQNAEDRRNYYQVWYVTGPVNPQGERQWLSKSKVLLRNVRRKLRHPEAPEFFQ